VVVVEVVAAETALGGREIVCDCVDDSGVDDDSVDEEELEVSDEDVEEVAEGVEDVDEDEGTAMRVGAGEV
jgi:hypothetical protein